MKLITAIAALALVAGSFILVQPALAKIQNVDDESWCVAAGFKVLNPKSETLNVNLFDCDDMRVNLDGTYPDDHCCRAPSEDYINLNNEGTPYLPIVEIDGPPFEWVYDTETQYIRSKRKPYYTPSLQHLLVESEEQWKQMYAYRCFGVHPSDPAGHNPLPWNGHGSTIFKSFYCSTNNPNVPEIEPTKWVYDSDTQFVHLEAFPAWCLTMGPGPKDLDVPPQYQRDNYVYIAWCGDPSEHWAQLGATYGSFPEEWSQRWEIPIAESGEEEEPEEEPRRSRVTVPGEEEEPEEEPRRSRVTVPGEEEEPEDDGQILNKNGKLGSKKRGKN